MRFTMKKLITLSGFATIVTFGLFSFMAYLISSEQQVPISLDKQIIVDVFQTPEDSKVNEIDRPKLRPPEPKTPVAPTSEQPTEVMVSNEIGFTQTDIKLPNTTTALGNIGNAPDRDARPIVRVNPKYPIQAAQEGIQGWVLLSFDINPIGEVVNVDVIDAEPKRLFDKAAKQALRKWKYRAKTENGVAISQHNLQVKLEFNMEQQS